MKPVAYAMFRDGEYYDAIHPDEYIKTAGEYDTPLYTYTHPADLTDEEIVSLINKHIDYVPDGDGMKVVGLMDLCRAILRKAQGEG